ncbi:MAG: RNA polymerase factor sigma-54 [Gammaproteobacteria bacterium]|nr:RNA polymerase factor sigma-54 [Gammaproteobacteria bacterium]
MKQSLQLRLGQHLTMTPQLQQAIRLLQLSTLDLRQEIQQALDSNLMLELEEGQDEPEEQKTPDDSPADTTAERTEELELQPTTIPDELPVDSNWEDTYDNTSPATSTSSHSADDRQFETGDTTEEGLREGLLWQLGMVPISERDQTIGETIIDDINDDGFLATTLEELHQSLPTEMEVELDEVEAVLHTIQNFDPPGIAARNLRESLLLQLRSIAEETPWINEARHLLEDYFDLLANHDYNQLKRRLKLDEDTLRSTLELIQSLNPRPGSQISNSKPEYITPDVYVRRTNGSWRVELNQEASPRLRINNHYASLIKQVNNTGDSTYMKNHLQEARWFIKSLQSRNETLLKVAKCIVERQRGFLEHGDVAMKALVLHDIAQEVDMHESTISRVTTRKYLHTPRGIFELKYFFSSHVSTAAGGECSSTAIRAFIKEMIAEENIAKPLSDSKIATVLSEQGINVARRTIAKYREAMNIPPSNERKRLA